MPLTALLVGLCPALATPAGASSSGSTTGSTDPCMSGPAFTYLPQIQVVNLFNFDTGVNLTPQMYCGVVSLEDNAYELYAETHGMSPGDPRIAQDGSEWIAGVVWSQIEAIAYSEHNGYTENLTDDEIGAYQWFQALLHNYNLTAAQDSLNEYNKWLNDLCNYKPPSTTVFSFDPQGDPACAGLSSILSGPTPPTYQDFIAFGSYDASHSLLTSLPNLPPAGLANVNQAIEDGAAAGTGLLIGGGLTLAKAINPAFGETWTKSLFPFRFQKTAIAQEPKQAQSAERTMQENQEVTTDEEEIEADEVEGEDPPPSLEENVSTELGEDALSEEAIPQVTTNVGRVVTNALSLSDFAGIFSIAMVAATILATEAIALVNQQQIPGQLQDNINSASPDPDVWNAIMQPGAGESLPFTLFEAQLNNSQVGLQTTVSAPPASGDAFSVGIGNTDSIVHSTSIETWPIGPDALGSLVNAPSTTLTLANGEVFRTPLPDDKAAGLTSGYIPTGEIDYINWQYGQQVALVDGDQFINLTSPGTIDDGGNDTEAACVQANSCEVTPSIEALNSDGVPVVISIVQDSGTIATAEVTNQYGDPAGTSLSGPSDGLVSGQTVTLSDPETNPVGGSTTYEWQIETRCAYNAAHPTKTLDGVPFCYGDPDYNDIVLPSSEADLSNGGTEDPAFHGDPVDIETGQSVSYTWPGPGTYHVRLITTDAFGKTHTYDKDLTVVDDTPRLALTTTDGWAGPSAIGPIANGSTAEISGCIDSPAAAYGDPEVTIDWGDGSGSDSQYALGGGSPDIAFSTGPSASCGSLWSFTATHSYEVSSPAAIVQDPLTVTVTDGFGGSTTDDLALDISTPTAPSFTTPAQGTLTTGEIGTVTVSASGDPSPTITESGALPPGIGFDSGTFTGNGAFSGDAHIGDGGAYPVTLTATNSTGSVTQSFTLYVNDAPAFTGGTSATMTVGDDSNVLIGASGYPPPFVSIIGTLPNGVDAFDSNDGSAGLFGTPAAGAEGSYPLTVEAGSPAGTVTETFTLNVVSAPAITSGTVADFTVGSFSSFGVSTAGTPPPSLSVSGALPSGISFEDYGNGTGAFYGTASSPGTTVVTLNATSPGGTVSQQITLNASSTGGPPITSASSTNFEVGTDTTFTITSSDPNATISCRECSTHLPPGLTFTGGTGSATISGTPDAGTAGVYDQLIFATDGGTSSEFLQLSVYGTPDFTSASSAPFSVGLPSTFVVTANAWPLATDISVVGALPAGLSFTNNSDGTATISGTPEAGSAGTYPVELRAENYLDIGSPVLQQLTIDVSEPLAITSPDTANYDGQFTVTASGTPPPALVVSGTLPPGLTFTDNGNGTATFSGQPQVSAITTYDLTVTASSSEGSTSQALELTVGPSLSFLSPQTATFAAGSPGTFTVEAPDTPTPSLTLVGTLPAGLTFTDNGDGTATITGTPTGEDGQSVVVGIDASNTFGSLTQELTVDVDAPPSFTAATTATFLAGDPDQGWQLNATGFPVPSYALGGNLPDGVTFSTNGDGTASISGDPALGTSGTYPLNLTLGNGSGSVTTALTLVVVEPPGLPQQLDPVTFNAAQASSTTVTATGSPTPSITATQMNGSPLPTWLNATDNGDGTLTVSGTPPTSALNTNVFVDITASNGIGLDAETILPVMVPGIDLTSSPPAADVGQPYSFQFLVGGGTGAAPTFDVTKGSTLPPGLSLTSAGLLSGAPSVIGSFTFSVDVYAGPFEVTQSFTMMVVPGPHPLEISQFRLYGPGGAGDWYVDVENTTAAPVSLAGWDVGIDLGGESSPMLVGLGRGLLAPGAQALVEGPASSYLGSITPSGQGLGLAATPGGVDVIAPGGTVSDSVGEVGSANSLITGSGLAVPTAEQEAAGDAFVRIASGGGLQDTGDNASDFTVESPSPSSYQSGGLVTLFPKNDLIGNEAVELWGTNWTDSSVTVYECAVAFYSAAQCDQSNAIEPVLEQETPSTYRFRLIDMTLAAGIIDTNGDTCGLATSATCYLVALGASGDETDVGALGFLAPRVAPNRLSGVTTLTGDRLNVSHFPVGDHIEAFECDTSVTLPGGVGRHCDSATEIAGTVSATGVGIFPRGIPIRVGSAFADPAGGTVTPGGHAVLVVVDSDNPSFDGGVRVSIGG